MKALSVMFILIGALSCFLGYLNTQEFEKERLTRELKETLESGKDVQESLGRVSELLGGDSTYDSRKYDGEIAKSSSEYSSLRNEREEAMKWFFVAGAGFIILRLILFVTANELRRSRAAVPPVTGTFVNKVDTKISDLPPIISEDSE